MARAFTVEVDVSKLDRLADRLGDLSGEALGEMSMRVVNEVVDETYDLALPRMLSRINLTEPYVRERMTVNKATSPDLPKASIVASGDRRLMTTLARYDGQQAVKPVNWSNDRIAGMGKKFAPWPGWTKRTGDDRRGIAANMKGAGATVEVVRGRRKPIEDAFFMPLRNGNGMGIFRRTGKGDRDYKHTYGPSVYQLFAYTAKAIINDVADNLENRVATEAERLLENKLS
ncbi:MAG: phage tail protein [Hydrogenophaga sp.]|nr:phage tail protein [Hydrogenophaga sp.]